MGAKYFVEARNYNVLYWEFSLYTNSFIRFIGAVIKCAIKYKLVDIGIRKESREDEYV